jgi:two-component system NtrC family sensor kinase
MNLLGNAAQAVADKGEVSIATRRDGDWVTIAIRDTGIGIAEDQLSRIFDPFFTTKPVGEGTGLGLSISYGIIERHGGSITVTSEVGSGTTFTVRIPTCAADVELAKN